MTMILSMALSKKKFLIVSISFVIMILSLSGAYGIATLQVRQFVENGRQLISELSEDNMFSLLGHLADGRKDSFYLIQREHASVLADAVYIVDFHDTVVASTGSVACNKPSCYMYSSDIQKTEKENVQYVQFKDGKKEILFESIIEVGGEKIGKTQVFTSVPLYYIILWKIKTISMVFILVWFIFFLILFVKE